MAKHNKIILPDGSNREVDPQPFRVAMSIESFCKQNSIPRHALIGACFLLIGSQLGSAVKEFDAMSSASEKDA